MKWLGYSEQNGGIVNLAMLVLDDDVTPEKALEILDTMKDQIQNPEAWEKL